PMTSSRCPPARLLLCTDPPTPEISSLSLHDALPISRWAPPATRSAPTRARPRRLAPRRFTATSCRTTPSSRARTTSAPARGSFRSEEHTSELQSLTNLVCRLLLEKKISHHRLTTRMH